MAFITAAAGRTGKYFKAALRFILKNAGSCAYYSSVVLALGLIAFAAQNLREERIEREEEFVIPAVEISAAEESQPQPEFIMPENYILLREYSASPVWNADMGCWQTHPASDYTVEDLLVRSICEGNVQEMGEDCILGGYIEVLAGEYLIRYASIEINEDIEEGTAISSGDVIGKMNTSCPGEGYMRSHLHLEIMRNGSYVDPAQMG